MDDYTSISQGREIDSLTEQLSMAIRNSEEYLHYHEVYQRIRQDEELYNSVNELRRNNYYLQNAGSGAMSNEEYMNIAGFSRTLHDNPLVNEFLNAEVELARLTQDIFQQLLSNIEFDIDFL